MGAFIFENCTVREGATVRGSVFYDSYCKWAEKTHLTKRETLSLASFGRKMGERFPKSRDRLGAVYHGVGLVAECDGLEGNPHVFFP
ncbi:MAG: hypothetical protein HYU29_07600 [Chloroflexi bacterium]|nr:hypothetical protein [Chloroflexota bacterium]